MLSLESMLICCFGESGYWMGLKPAGLVRGNSLRYDAQLRTSRSELHRPILIQNSRGKTKFAHLEMYRVAHAVGP